MTQAQIDEKLAYLAQMLDDRVAKVINEALYDYAYKTLGADRAIAIQIAQIFGKH